MKVRNECKKKRQCKDAEDERDMLEGVLRAFCGLIRYRYLHSQSIGAEN